MPSVIQKLCIGKIHSSMKSDQMAADVKCRKGRSKTNTNRIQWMGKPLNADFSNWHTSGNSGTAGWAQMNLVPTCWTSLCGWPHAGRFSCGPVCHMPSSRQSATGQSARNRARIPTQRKHHRCNAWCNLALIQFCPHTTHHITSRSTAERGRNNRYLQQTSVSLDHLAATATAF